jgi:hypothetical protein
MADFEEMRNAVARATAIVDEEEETEEEPE